MEEEGENLLFVVLGSPELGAGMRLTTFLVAPNSGFRAILPPQPAGLSFSLVY